MKTCPKCIVKLDRKNIGEIEVEECHQCKGIWFERDELRQAKDTTDPDLNWMDFDIWKHHDKFTSQESPLDCPACGVKTRGIRYGSTSIEIDYCTSCEGIWLDKGEFEKIINEMEGELNTKSFGEYIVETLKEAKELVTGTEGFVSEWKDFITVVRMMKYRLFADNPKLMDALIKGQKHSPFK